MTHLHIPPLLKNVPWFEDVALLHIDSILRALIKIELLLLEVIEVLLLLEVIEAILTK